MLFLSKKFPGASSGTLDLLVQQGPGSIAKIGAMGASIPARIFGGCSLCCSLFSILCYCSML